MKKNELKVSICIVTYNRNKDVFECLTSIFSSKYKNFEVIVFDNHSRKKLERRKLMIFPKLKYIYYKKNIGVAGGKAICEKIARGDYLLMLDDDTIIDEYMITKLVEVLNKDPNIGIAAPKSYYYDQGKTNIILGGLGRISKITTLCDDIAYRQKDKGQFNKITPIDYAQNGYMLRKKLSQELGGHDAKFIMTYAETDFFLRAQEIGYRTVYVPKANLWHKVNLINRKNKILRDELGLVRPQRIFHNMRNRSVFVKKHSTWYAKIFYLFILVHLFFLYYFYKFILHKAPKEYFINLINGYLEGLIIFIGVKEL